MSTESNEHTLEGLAQRVKTLERENASLRHEVVARANAALDFVTCKRLTAEDNATSVQVEGLVYAHNHNTGSALRGINAGAYAMPAIFGDGQGIGGIGARGIGGMYGVDGATNSDNEDSIGVRGISYAGTGVKGEGSPGVRGMSKYGTTGTGVKGEGSPGVWGTSRDDSGVVGDGIGSSRAGVLGRNSSGAGVKGEGTFAGVSGSSSMPGSFSDLPSGVYGEHTGQGGYGVRGFGDTGVWGQGHKGDGVRGQSTSRFYAGVYGENTSTGILGGPGGGIGGRFKGGRAQVMLDPNASSGSPETGEHSKGELFMDSEADLFVCVASSTATAGAKWKKVATTAV